MRAVALPPPAPDCSSSRCRRYVLYGTGHCTAHMLILSHIVMSAMLSNGHSLWMVTVCFRGLHLLGGSSLWAAWAGSLLQAGGRQQLRMAPHPDRNQR